MAQNRDKSPNGSKSRTYKNSSPSTQFIKDQLRRRFQERLKISRSTQQSRNRDFYNSIVSDVRKQFIHSIAIEEDLNAERLIEVLLEIEQELNERALQEEADNYQLLLEQEINEFEQRASVLCQICNQPVQSPYLPNNVICNECGNLHFSNEKL